MGIYTASNVSVSINSPKRHTSECSAHLLQEESGNGTSGKSTANLEARCSAGELAGRRGVRSSAGWLSTAHDGAGGVAGASWDRGNGLGATLDGVTGASGHGRHGDNNAGGVRRWAGDGVGSRGRGGVLCQWAVRTVRQIHVDEG
jgi:hypothetical protein